MGRNLYWLVGWQLLLFATASASAESPTIPDDIELHGVNINRGYYKGDDAPPPREHRMSYATVKVDRPGKLVCLFLAAAEPVTWSVEATDGTQLKEIILGGDYQQEAVGDLAGVEIKPRFRSAELPPTDALLGTRGYIPSRDVLNGERIVETPDRRFKNEELLGGADPDKRAQATTDYEFSVTSNRLQQATGLKFTSFHSHYQAREDVPLMVSGTIAAFESDSIFELHGVSIYGGDTVAVKVDRPGKRVILFLATFKPVTWNVEAASGTVVEQIILGGQQRSELTLPSRNIKTVSLYASQDSDASVGGTRGSAPSADVLAGQRRVSVNPELSIRARKNYGAPGFEQLKIDYKFTRTAQQLKDLIGLPLQSFWTQRHPRDDTPIVIRKHDAWLATDPVVELHGVSIHHGYDKGGAGHPAQFATVRVDRPGKRIILFLSAYDGVTWDVKLGQGTSLEGIILGGYFEQKLSENLVGIKTLERWNELSITPVLLGTFGKVPSDDVRAGVRRIDEPPIIESTGKLISSATVRKHEQAVTDYQFSQITLALLQLTGIELKSFVTETAASAESPIVIGDNR